MPTYEQTTAFLRDFDRLTRAQQEQFIAAVYLFIADIVAMDVGQIDRFRPGLRVKGVQGEPGLFEMTWARNGRATSDNALIPPAAATRRLTVHSGASGVQRSLHKTHDRPVQERLGSESDTGSRIAFLATPQQQRIRGRWCQCPLAYTAMDYL